MSCEIFPKDISNTVKNSLVDKFETARPSVGGLSVTIYENLGNVSVIRDQIQDEVNHINESFYSETYGEVVSFQRKDSKSYEVDITVPDALVEAMNVQRLARDAQDTKTKTTAYDEVFVPNGKSLAGIVFDSARQQQNSQVPITDNVFEYIQHKKALLQTVEARLRELKKSHKNPLFQGQKKADILTEIQNTMKFQKQLDQQIEALSQNTPAVIYSMLMDDINNIRKSIAEGGNFDEIKARMDFLSLMITGFNTDKSVKWEKPFLALDSNGNEIFTQERQELLKALNDLDLEFGESIERMRDDILESDVLYANTKQTAMAAEIKKLEEENKEQIKTTGKGMTQAELLAEASNRVALMFKPGEDLNWLEKMFLGVGTSSVNNGVAAQVALSQFKEKMNLREAEVKGYLDRLKRIMRKFHETDKNEKFQWIFEVTENGNKTGNIVGKFSSAYNNLLKEFYNPSENKKNHEETYKSRIEWLNKNAHVIDFTQLPEVKAIYGNIYPGEFRHSDVEMDRYSTWLKQELGSMYESEINLILASLENFQMEQSVLLGDTTDKYRHKKIAENNPWAFLKHYNSPSRGQSMPYTSGPTTDHAYPNMSNTRFIPKRQSVVGTDNLGNLLYEDTGFYNKTFEDSIENDPDKFEYWELMKEIYSEYVNPTYSDLPQNMSYAKFEMEWLETLTEVKGVKKMSAFLRNVGSQYAGFFYERGHAKDDITGIRKNYGDKSRRDSYALMELLGNLSTEDLIQKIKDEKVNIPTDGLNDPDFNTRNFVKKKVVRELARAMSLKEYSTDINKVTEALLYMAASVKAREDVSPIVKLLSETEKRQNPTRKNANERFDSWIDRMINNDTEVYRGGTSFLGKSWTKDTLFGQVLNRMETLPVIKKFVNSQTLKKLTPNEQKMFKLMEDMKSGKSADDINFKFDEVEYQKITINGAASYMMGEPLSPEELKLLPTGDNTTHRIYTISEQDFDKAMEDYFAQKAEELGLDLNLAGVINGILKTIIYKGLGLNPASGVFNRIEGKNSSLVMDETGEYWTKGNVHKANNFLAFANITRMERFSKLFPIGSKKRLELQKLEIFLQQTNLVQNRKNELERAADNNERYIIGEDTLFAMAVDNPEFKNQSAILLSILMDTKVKDIDGNEHPIFDGKEFVIWDLVGGQLVLKDKFKGVDNNENNEINWQNFSVNENSRTVEANQFHLTKSKISNAISVSQGNYDGNDVIMATKNIWGRTLTLFMKWMPSHIQQRFSSGKGMDIFNGKKDIKGRYRYAWENPSALMSGGLASSALFFGFTPGLIAAGVGLTGIVALQYFRRMSNPNSIKKEILSLNEFVGFTKAMVISSINYPLEMFNSKTVLSHDALSKFMPGYQSTNLSEEEIGNLRAVAKEIGIRLNYIILLLMLSKLTWDDDDERDSRRRQFHNYLDNQLMKSNDALADYMSPSALYDNVTRFAFLSYLTKLTSLLGGAATGDFGGKGMENLLAVTPLPRLLTNGAGFDSVDYTPGTWMDKEIQNRGYKGKYDKHKEQVVKEITAELDKKKLVGEKREEEMKKLKRERILSKSKQLTYEETMEIIAATKDPKRQKEKQASLAKKKKRQEELEKKKK